MTFDEAIKKFEQEANEYVNEYNGLVSMETVYELILNLKEEYAPTVEMTKEQGRVFQIYYDSENPFNKNGFEYPDNLFMKSIKEKELIQAWLHPETIKVVD